MAGILGQTLCKVNGVFHLDVTDSNWNTQRPVPQQTTGAGNVSALGTPKATVTIGEVAPRTGALNWFALQDFTIDFYDKETRSIVVASFSGCNWNTLGGSSNMASAETKKNIGLVVNTINQA